MTLAKQKIAIVTGANNGVGFGICQRLAESNENVKIVMACRNKGKATKARDSLLSQFPDTDIEIEQLDVGNVKSVFNFCAAINSKHTHIDYLFCNAGILDSSHIDWKLAAYMLCFDTISLIEQADVTVQIAGEVNPDGLGKVFATNVFGHYVIIRELETLLSKSGEGRVIWTSSLTSKSSFFDINDWQGLKTNYPYESSKWAIDLISIYTEERFKKEEKHISSFTTSPGVVASAIANLARWIVLARLVLHYVMRLCGVTSQNITAYNGSLADIFAAFEPLDTLDHFCRYNACTSRLGHNYVEGVRIEDYNPDTAQQLVTNCELSYRSFKKLYKVEASLAPAN